MAELDLNQLSAQIQRQRLLIAKVDEYADRIWRSRNSAYRKAGRDLLEMIAIAREGERGTPQNAVTVEDDRIVRVRELGETFIREADTFNPVEAAMLRFAGARILAALDGEAGEEK